MKDHDAQAEPAQCQAAAVPERQALNGANGLALHVRRSTLQFAIDQSPRMQAQRSAISAAFGRAIQRKAYEVEGDEPLRAHMDTAQAESALVQNESTPAVAQLESLKTAQTSAPTPNPVWAKSFEASPNLTGMPAQLKADVKVIAPAQPERFRVNSQDTWINRRTMQLLKVADDHVRADLRHEKRDKLFEDYTIEDIQQRAYEKLDDRSKKSLKDKNSIDRVSNDDLDAVVATSRSEGKMDYKQLSQEKVNSEKELTAFLDKRESDEHMYVLHDDSLHVAIRAEAKKLPHPTLIGGDPDVDCAGTMRRSNDDDVIVTASSGHFRPPSEKLGQAKVNKLMNKTASKGRKVNVKGSRR